MALRLDGQFHTGVNRFAVEQHGARTARGAVASLLRAGESGMIAQGVQQGLARLEVQLERLAVDSEGDGNLSRSEGLVGPEFLQLFNFGGDGAHRRGRRGDDDSPQSFQKRAAADFRVARLVVGSLTHATDDRPQRRRARVGQMWLERLCLRRNDPGRRCSCRDRSIAMPAPARKQPSCW